MAEPIVTRPLEVNDFSGGKTDNYISGSPIQFQDADNMVLKRYGNKAKLVTRPGSVLYDEDYPRIPANDRLSTLADVDETLFQIHGRNIYTIGGSGWETVLGPTSNPAIGAGSSSSYHAWARWNKHLVVTSDSLSRPMKVFNDGSDWVARNLGLPTVDTSGITITPPTAGSSHNYIYAFIYSDSYTIDSITYREVGAVAVKQVTAGAAPGAAALAYALTGLPAISNGATGNYATSSLKLEIYRTEDDGSLFYKVGEVTNGTTTFNDTTTDANVVNGISLYTDGGTQDFSEPPPCKYLTVANDCAWYAHVQEDSSVYPQRVRQSVQGALYAAPESYYTDVDDAITGIGAVNIYPIVFTKGRAYRLEGVVDELGRGSTVKREISSTVGCVSHRSIVQTRDGLYWAGKEGFYYTDGFNVRKISQEFPDSFAELVASDTQSSRIYGTYDPIYNRIWWAAQRDAVSSDNDVVFVAHLDAPNTPFTTLSGGNDTDNFAPSSLHFFGGYILRGDRRGYLLRHDDDLLADPLIDTNVTPSDWGTSAIIYDYRGVAFDFGTTEVRKWVPRIVVNADNVANLSLTIFSNNDNSGVFNELAEIKYQGSSFWGDPTATWGDPNARWNYSTVISHWRRFPAGGLRCSFKQVRLTNSYTEIETSTLGGTATTEGLLNTVTLDDVSKTWVPDAAQYFISFSHDGYLREWEIEARTDTELTVSNDDSSLPTETGLDWRINGYKKNDVLNLLSYVIEYAPLTMTQEAYRVSS